MITSYASLPDLVIPNGQTHSQVFNGVYVYHDAVGGIEIYSPDTLPESVYIEVNQDQLATNSSSGWKPIETFDDTGASVRLYVPGAGKAQTYTDMIPAGSFRLTSTTAVVADRTFKCNKLWST